MSYRRSRVIPRAEVEEGARLGVLRARAIDRARVILERAQNSAEQWLHAALLVVLRAREVAQRLAQLGQLSDELGQRHSLEPRLLGRRLVSLGQVELQPRPRARTCNNGGTRRAPEA